MPFVFAEAIIEAVEMLMSCNFRRDIALEFTFTNTK